jgi:tetratricopeptide (TPR) repeat protein
LELNVTTQTTLAASGLCDLWPEIGHQFLSLNDLSIPIRCETPEQHLLRESLLHFDVLSACNLRDFLRASSFFKRNHAELVKNPVLREVTEGLLAWSNLDYASAEVSFKRHLQQYPTDVMAMFILHMLDFCIGKTARLISHCDVVDAQMDEQHPFYAYYLAIKSFVLCENGRYQEALEVGLAGFNLIKDNIYAIHAVSHAYHEMNEHEKVIEFLGTNMRFWINNPGMKMHVYWHSAIAEMNMLSFDKAHEAFNSFYSMKSSPDAEQDLDAVGFLWRHKLCFPEDNRYDQVWDILAENWTGCIGASTSYFHDMHAALAFAAANKPFLIKKMINRSDGVGIPPEAHAVGGDILQAIFHYAMREYSKCAELLNQTKADWVYIGGSHAQRELLSLTLHNATLLTAIHALEGVRQQNIANRDLPLGTFLHDKQKARF